MANKTKAGPLVWIDLEMTGLEPETCSIIEIATLVTDDDLEIVAEGPELVIHQPESLLATMDEWNVTHHTASGLLERVRASSVELHEAERRTLEFLAGFCEPGAAVLCGNSVGQDRRFLRAYMPTLEAFFHYRIVDVSSLKVLVGRWYPPEQGAAPKLETHRALEDIRESVAELRHYRATVFRPSLSREA
jgi:oligoribonuclease